MIVVAIIGILAAIAMPAYQDYVIRAQISEGLHLMSSAKAAVSEYHQDRGLFAADNATAGLEAPGAIRGKYVTQIEVVAGGLVQATFGNDANLNITGAVLTLTPNANAGSIEWTCTGDATLVAKWIPAACR